MKEADKCKKTVAYQSSRFFKLNLIWDKEKKYTSNRVIVKAIFSISYKRQDALWSGKIIKRNMFDILPWETCREEMENTNDFHIIQPSESPSY